MKHIVSGQFSPAWQAVIVAKKKEKLEFMALENKLQADR